MEAVISHQHLLQSCFFFLPFSQKTSFVIHLQTRLARLSHQLSTSEWLEQCGKPATVHFLVYFLLFLPNVSTACAVHSQAVREHDPQLAMISANSVAVATGWPLNKLAGSGYESRQEGSKSRCGVICCFRTQLSDKSALRAAFKNISTEVFIFISSSHPSVDR